MWEGCLVDLTPVGTAADVEVFLVRVDGDFGVDGGVS